ncbi:MAG: ferrous iron transport protein A [Verrucomicrobia bacterium]|nr:ferrous iron transport protein A [Verrucomicrobiota bacterium]|tara:strand:+ start:880 stop:1125 length:246 start_codon:yes stop_codon:yes gene_type:complete
MDYSTLDQIKKGEVVLIEQIQSEDLAIQLQHLGCVPGVSIRLERKAPLGDPLIFRLDQSFISVRLSDARNIQVQRNPKVAL